jgi:hypothetical protein
MQGPSGTTEVGVWPKEPGQVRARMAAAPSDDGDGIGKPALVQCSAALQGDAATTCQAYSAYNRYLAMGGAAILVGADVAYAALEKAGDASIALDVYNGCGAVYTAIQGMAQAFVDGIDDLNANKPFSLVEPPSELPDFPPTPSTGDEAKSLIEGVWMLVQSSLLLVVGKLSDGSLKVALSGLLANGDKALQQLIPILDKAFG